MSFDEEIRDRFLADTETILQGHLDDLEGMFQFHEDGSIEPLGEYRKVKPQDRILIHLIARRYQYEGEMSESPELSYGEVYSVFPDKSKSTVRGYFMDLRDAGFAKKGDDGHELVVERLPEAVERIEDAVTD